ncbi:TetR/AcrR family transcriptional regulator [Ktedonosporobacter rubrisoli]|uniref:TetR/AcrR family transcriptional regulator n=1 Tax=Ktedonosporobacter rubrisoli TaxID=2509675 RepID=A0A4P6JT89_KTERU|nr:TetR/AcrR family transcriptional regulator [Ktedonosporobacter rubrisoli]QBD78513.1 TetR/AcrR family transcriptional regulator [Ktedonosporobacter rubrisoli]
MVYQGQQANPQAQEFTRREARAHRILDAAAALILRWGYNKTTLDDIARQAGVAKATMYLHWKTREELFAALIRREKVVVAEDIKQRVSADPEGTTLSGLLKHSALALLQSPLLKAVIMRDMEVLGKLAHREQSNAAHLEKMEGFKLYFEFLREHGLVRTDLSLTKQIYMFSAIFTGFFLVAPLMSDEYALSDEEMAELMAETGKRILEPAHAASTAELQKISSIFLQYLDRSVEIAREQFQKEVEA